ncbi:SRPBCC family protein [Halalkaliarchaeum sp. AArc-GB]|uniref:SRPBCC family protein n=1 Tax=unclassified Halalkaliarchaeum TaxID=2678344 RepID=UPI00217DE3CD|nr:MULTISPECIES: SRPBCC family protein [unclassified Halalkaliarchaeum]MDR5672348.1 SRPBCC family protein [Halalkaliarchaeum sp. AArc-GB]
MPTYRRETRIAAPLEDVWEFHSRPDGLEALTPDWMGMSVESVRGPDGERNPPILEQGAQLRLSMRPFGVGPRFSFTARIVERCREEGRAWFRDDMVGGPFRKWEHTHSFFGDADETVMVDTVEYELPGGRLNVLASPVSSLGFDGMFRRRHAKTRELLSGQDAD